ncbi:cation diffusion facilitator family transporter [Bythopirellula polymerisocia]|uniref:Ferrous iron efflux protein F n=1 Tax=Bythopirellula polymerisocia TaxID=2528003 RepID=A0A5C6CGI5_9BACT|nr:cation transporter [Bythopirellula polymerisocia]TWU21849.1 ferrous iron efflux protein F [Bythopirellula polymerisocia]
MSDTHNLEQRGLWLSVAGALFMAALGIGFAIVTSSDAVLLDGLFSLVGCVVGLMALRVASLVKRPDDDLFHFGYAAYEPMLNLTKGLLMGFVSLFALVSSVADAIQGGRDVNVGWALFYAVIAAAGCFAIALTQHRLAIKIRSPLIEVDAKNWLVDGVLSVAVAVAFLVAILLSGTRLSPLLPYTDSTVVIILVLVSFPIPAKIIRDNWNQLIGRAPDEAHQMRVRELIASALRLEVVADTKIRMQQVGRFTYVQLYVVCHSDPEGGILSLDRFRDNVAKALAGEFSHLAMDIIFTRDPRWVAESVGSSEMCLMYEDD